MVKVTIQVPGYTNQDIRIWKQEGLLPPEEVNSLRKEASKKLEQINLVPNAPYKIPLISHGVYVTDPDNPIITKDQYVACRKRIVKLLNAEDSNFIHFIWTNNPDSISEEIKKLPNVIIKDIQEFSNHPLFNKVIQLIAEKNYVMASDIIRVFALKIYGGVYLDMDYMLYKAASLVQKYMKSFSYINGEESEQHYACDIGNAFTACTPNHRVMQINIDLFDRNLNHIENVPDYALRPDNSVYGVIYNTGPTVTKTAYYLYKKEINDEQDDTIILPYRIIYNNEYVVKELGYIQNNNISFASTDLEPYYPIPEDLTGGDPLSGTWGDYTTINYYNNIELKNITSQELSIFFNRTIVEEGDNLIEREEFVKLFSTVIKYDEHDLVDELWNGFTSNQIPLNETSPAIILQWTRSIASDLIKSIMKVMIKRDLVKDEHISDLLPSSTSYANPYYAGSYNKIHSKKEENIDPAKTLEVFKKLSAIYYSDPELINDLISLANDSSKILNNLFDIVLNKHELTFKQLKIAESIVKIANNEKQKQSSNNFYEESLPKIITKMQVDNKLEQYKNLLKTDSNNIIDRFINIITVKKAPFCDVHSQKFDEHDQQINFNQCENKNPELAILEQESNKTKDITINDAYAIMKISRLINDCNNMKKGNFLDICMELDEKCIASNECLDGDGILTMLADGNNYCCLFEDFL